MSDFQSFERRRARLPHYCSHCMTLITPGTVYEYGSGVWEGDWFQQSCHLECVEAARAVHRHQDEVWGRCDSYPWLWDLEAEDFAFLANHSPEIHARIAAQRGSVQPVTL